MPSKKERDEIEKIKIENTNLKTELLNQSKWYKSTIELMKKEKNELKIKIEEL